MCTHHSHPHSYQQGEYDEDGHDGLMMSGDRLGLKFPDICLMGNFPDRESNPTKAYRRLKVIINLF
ncbi:hypothetical protein C0J52_25890 [Blattella germanica]|nr:hypothetical protein C0J52_25890 [Blattella germanica]